MRDDAATSAPAAVEPMRPPEGFESVKVSVVEGHRHLDGLACPVMQIRMARLRDDGDAGRREARRASPPSTRPTSPRQCPTSPASALTPSRNLEHD